MKTVRSLVLCVCLLVAGVESACYYPNGNLVSDTPCNRGSGNSTCCPPGYACLSNGLCGITEFISNIDKFDRSAAWYIRGTCTDKTWTDPACPRFCITASDGDDLSTGAVVEQCLSDAKDRFYCVNNVTKNMNRQDLCFARVHNMQMAALPTTMTIIGADYSPTATASVPLSTAASNTSATTPPLTPGTRQPDYSVAIGAGVGIPLGVVATAVIGFLYFRYRHSRGHKLSRQDTELSQIYNIRKQDTFYPMNAGAAELQIQSTWASASEMSSGTDAHELPTQHGN